MKKKYIVTIAVVAVLGVLRPVSSYAEAPNKQARVLQLYEKMSFGETREIVRVGTIAVEAKCIFNGGAGNPGHFNHLLVLLAKSDQQGALFRGEMTSLPDSFANSNEFLGPATQENRRRISSENGGQAGGPHFGARSGFGVIAGTRGEVIIISGNTGGFGFEVAGADCLLVDQVTVYDGR